MYVMRSLACITSSTDMCVMRSLACSTSNPAMYLMRGLASIISRTAINVLRGFASQVFMFYRTLGCYKDQNWVLFSSTSITASLLAPILSAHLMQTLLLLLLVEMSYRLQ